MTDRRVSLTITTITNEAPAEVLYSALVAICDEAGFEIESVHVHAFDLDESGDEPMVHLVVADNMVKVAVTDYDGARSAASACRGVIASLPIAEDLRSATE